MFDARGISVPLHLRLRTANDCVFRPVCLERKLVQLGPNVAIRNLLTMAAAVT